MHACFLFGTAINSLMNKAEFLLPSKVQFISGKQRRDVSTGVQRAQLQALIPVGTRPLALKILQLGVSTCLDFFFLGQCEHLDLCTYVALARGNREETWAPLQTDPGSSSHVYYHARALKITGSHYLRPRYDEQGV